MKKVFKTKDGIKLLKMLRDFYVDENTHKLDATSLAYQAGQRDVILDFINETKADFDINYHDSDDLNIIVNETGEL